MIDKRAEFFKERRRAQFRAFENYDKAARDAGQQIIDVWLEWPFWFRPGGRNNNNNTHKYKDKQ